MKAKCGADVMAVLAGANPAAKELAVSLDSSVDIMTRMTSERALVSRRRCRGCCIS